MSLHPTRGFYFNKAFYLRVTLSDGSMPCFKTDVLEFDAVTFSGVNNNQIIVPIKKSQSESLYTEVLAAEHAVALLIRELDGSIIADVPQVCKDIYERYNQTHSLVRSIYRFTSNETEPTFYLKGNIGAMKVTDWSDNPINPKQLGQGRYQFIIRANLLYFGTHQDETCMVNLQLRISHLRFTPLTSILSDGVDDNGSDKQKQMGAELSNTIAVTPSNSPASAAKRIKHAPKRKAF